jgi:tRNA(Ser,Leu) C12 N-acetylase TAN1
MTSDDEGKYLAFAVAGLEWVVVEELTLAGATDISVVEQVLQHGAAGLGKVIFRLNESASIVVIEGLRSVQRVLSLICIIPDVPSGFGDGCNLELAKGPKNQKNRRRNNLADSNSVSGAHAPVAPSIGNKALQKEQKETVQKEVAQKEAALQQICKSVIEGGDWQNAQRVRVRHRVRDTQAQAPGSFRVSCVRGGKHKYSSVELSQWVGGAVHDEFGWKVDLRGYESEIVLVLLQTSAVVGMSFDRGGESASVGQSAGQKDPLGR